MSTFSSKVIVNTDLETLWDILVDKIRSPQKYVPGVKDVQIKEEYSELSVLREMTVSIGENDKRVREFIFADKKTRTVIFKLDNDPNFCGYVINTIYQSDDCLELEYLLQWTPKPGIDIPVPDLGEVILNAVVHTKEIAESNLSK